MHGSILRPPRIAGADLRKIPRTVRVLLTSSAGGREVRRELGKFATLEEAIAVGQRLVDVFLWNYLHSSLRGEELYRHYLRFGPDIEVDAALGQPVFEACHYARRRSRQICGVW